MWPFRRLHPHLSGRLSPLDVLVRSIQHVSPDIPIMIIPGEGFGGDDHPFDVPVRAGADRFLGEIGHQDRCFWAFQGPFATFLYLDADMSSTKSVENLATDKRTARLFYLRPPVNRQSRLVNSIHDPDSWKTRNMRSRSSAKLAGIHWQFDPDYNIFADCPFNTGLFASRRLAITESDPASFNKAREKVLSQVAQEGMELEIERAVFSRPRPPQLSGQQIVDFNLSSPTRFDMPARRRCNSRIF